MPKQTNSLKQQQTLKQRLSFQNIQLFRMMELNLLQFDQKVKEELDGNPALENLDEYHKSIEYNIESKSEKTHSNIKESSSDEFFERTESIDNRSQSQNANEISNYNYESRSGEEEDRDLYVSVEDHDTLISSLLNQLHFLNLTTKQILIGEYIIGNVDDDGYLRRTVTNIADDLVFRNNIEVSEQEVSSVLLLIQDLDPTGIGASTLQECLLLQLKKKKQTPYTNWAIEIVKNYFEGFTKNQNERIQRKLKISEEEFETVSKVIKSLNPKPTEKNFSESTIGKYIIPDFVLYRDEMKLELELNSYNKPNLAISNDFAQMLQRLKDEKKKSKSEKEAQDYITEKISKANLFISLVKERQETMIIIMNCILHMQREFFLTGQEGNLKPMGLKHIAAKTNFDISTVSRITNSKYIQTEFGVFSLKFFFSEGMTMESGEHISTRKIMKVLEAIVENENKENPFSDEQLTLELKKTGYLIARRTVAKYRENLNIPPRHSRKINPKKIRI